MGKGEFRSNTALHSEWGLFLSLSGWGLGKTFLWGLRDLGRPDLAVWDGITIGYNNLTNVFGISEDPAGCGKSNLVTPGSVESKLANYFNMPCFTTLPIVGADSIGTDFGDSATGIVDGPGQFNIDLSIMRNIPIAWPKEEKKE